jgi:hypothetical protein
MSALEHWVDIEDERAITVIVVALAVYYACLRFRRYLRHRTGSNNDSQKQHDH